MAVVVKCKKDMDIRLLAERFYEYSNYMKGYSKHTIRRYRQSIRFYIEYSGIETIDEVTPENVRSLFYHGRTQRDWTPNTFICYYKSLVVFFRWCMRQGLLEKNPVEDIECPRVEKKLPNKLNQQDALRLLEVVYNYPYKYKFLRYRNHAIFATFLFAGLRKSELLNLKFMDVDLDNLTLFVRQGKGSKDRIIPISFTLAESLRRYIRERNRIHRTCPEFFTSKTFNGGLTETGLKRLIDSIQQASGTKFTAHKLRHSFATLMLEGGCDIYSLSRMMGHSDIKTTTIYLSASAEHLRSQITKHPLNNVLANNLR